jgi:hypothetical protein
MTHGSSRRATFAREIDQRLSEGVPLVVAAAPNGYSGFRWATQLDPLWNAYLLSATINLSTQIEDRRLPSDYVLSHRIDPSFPDGRLFVENAYAAFNERSIHEASSATHVVVTDIADFYSRVYHHRLENALEALPKVAGLQKKINAVLGRVAGNKSYGLPVGGPAARLLAELLLDRTDRLLLARRVHFLRYADDYRLFARSEDEAHGHLSTLAEVLATNEGLSLQKAKTRVMTTTEFVATVTVPSSHESRLSDKELSARQLLSFTLRFDPYSPTAAADYRRLEEEIDKIDLIDLFSVELGKSRVDPQFAKKLLKAVQYASPTTKSAVAESLALNLPLLAPVLPQTLASIKGLWNETQPVARAAIVATLVELCDANSYLLQTGVSRAYAVRVLAEDRTPPSEAALVSLYADPQSNPLVRRDVILAMASRGALWWLSDLMQRFQDLPSGWERRAFLASTQVMTEEAGHFLRKARRSLSPFDALTLEWAIDHRKADENWTPPI